MAFGFFKKKTSADLVFHNGKIYTHDEDFPYADAVACAEGKIIAVGDFDAMDDIISSDTQVVDLDGKYMLPGFIDVHRSPVMACFDEKYINLSDCADGDEACERIANWVDSHYGDETVFGYGYREGCEPNQDDIEEICEDRPLLLMCENGINCIINSAAADIVSATAEEECVEVVTPAYIFNLLLPFDFEEIEEAVKEVSEDLCDKGITSVLNMQTPSYFEAIYQDSLVGMYNEEQLNHRFFGSYLMNRPLVSKGLVYQLMNRKTTCVELDGMVNAQVLNIYLNQKDCPVDFTAEMLGEIMCDVADKGFDFFIEAMEYEDLLTAYQAVEAVRGQGYKNIITIASDYTLKEEDASLLEKDQSVITTWGSNLTAIHPVAAEVKTVSDAIDEMTVKADQIVGMGDSLGMIEKGRLADFVVFERNPFECDLRTFSRLHAEMTVVNGQIVYDAEGEMMDEIYNMMLSQHL